MTVRQSYQYDAPSLYQRPLADLDDTDEPESELEARLGPELFDLFDRRRSNNQDLLGVISDYHNRRGTGKTTLCLKTADATDQDGGLQKAACTFEPEELTEMYVNLPKKNAIVVEEVERAMSKYQAGSKVNQAVREVVSMGRVEEKYMWVNLPDLQMLDRDLLSLFDVWLLVTRRGEAIVHFLENNPYSGNTLTPRKQLIHWDPIKRSENQQLYNIYQWLDETKKGLLRDEGGEAFITEQEHREKLQQREQEVETEIRNQVIRDLYEYTDMKQEAIGNLPTIDLSRSRVGDIVSE